MLLRALLCGCGEYNLREVPLDHYSSGACPNPPLPHHKLKGILDNLLNDKVHCGGKITITRLLGCPRQPMLEDYFAHAIDPRSFFNLHEGSREHQDAADNAPPGFYAECTFPRPGQKPAELFGVELSGTLDLLHADFSTIEEYKKHSELGQYRFDKQRTTGSIDWTLAAQVNMQRLIVKQLMGQDVQRMKGWHLAMTKVGGAPNAIAFSLPRMSEEEIAVTKHGGSVYTVQENANFIKRFHTMLDQGVDKVSAAKAIPRAGTTMYVNRQGLNKCDLYCSAREVCDGVEGIRPLCGQPDSGVASGDDSSNPSLQ